MFYAITKTRRNGSGDETGTFHIASATHPEAWDWSRSEREFDTPAEAEAILPMVAWGEPDADADPDVVAAGQDD